MAGWVSIVGPALYEGHLRLPSWSLWMWPSYQNQNRPEFSLNIHLLTTLETKVNAIDLMPCSFPQTGLGRSVREDDITNHRHEGSRHHAQERAVDHVWDTLPHSVFFLASLLSMHYVHTHCVERDFAISCRRKDIETKIENSIPVLTV